MLELAYVIQVMNWILYLFETQDHDDQGIQAFDEYLYNGTPSYGANIWGNEEGKRGDVFNQEGIRKS